MQENSILFPISPQVLKKHKSSNMRKNFPSFLYTFFMLLHYVILLALKNERSPLFYCQIGLNFACLLGIVFLEIRLVLKIFLQFICRVFSLITISVLGKEYLIFSIYLIINIDEDNSNYTIIEQMLMKLGVLILICFKGDIIWITTISCILIFQILKKMITYKILTEKSVDNTLNNQSYISSNKQNDQIRANDDVWKLRMQILPISMLIVSMDNMQILYKNQTFYNFFSQYCEVEAVENFVLNKLSFHLIANNSAEPQEISSIHNILKKKLKQQKSLLYFQNNSCCQKQIDTLQDIPQPFQSLNDILNNFKSKTSFSFLHNHFTQFELNCTQMLDNGYCMQLFGQMVLNDKDQEIIIFLNDVTNQNELQQHLQKSDFQSKILQSFQHELRTPLNSSMNFLSAALDEKNIPYFVKSNLIEPSLNSLKIQSYLINDIIDFSSHYQKQIDLKLREFSISELVNEITSMFEYQFTIKQLAFDVNLTQNNSLVSFCTDYNKLMQILVNLVQNSLKFSLTGGCTLSIIPQANSNLYIEIFDQGQGIPLEKLMKIQQSCKTINKNEFAKDWQGIGLLISSILLQQLSPADNDTFQIQSEGENQGTKISFFIKNFVKIPFSKQNIRCSTSNYINFGSVSSQKKLTVSQQLQLNSSLINVMGKIVKTTEFHMVNNNIQTKTYGQYPSKKSNSLFSESNNEDFVDRKMNDLDSLSPFLITDLNHTIYKVKEKSSKFINLRQLKQLEERESDLFITALNNCKKCNCMKILSVDDEIFNQKSLQILISKLGFEVLLAYNGKQAIDMVLSQQKCSQSCCLLSLILMDYQMPIMDGLQATKELTKLMSLGQIPKIHIVGLTAFTNKSDLDKCYKSGMKDILAKPLNIKELKEILVYIFTN